MTVSLQSLPAPNPRSADPEILAREIVDRLTYRVGKDPTVAKPHDWLQAVILITRDRAIEYWMNATRTTYLDGEKRVYYLSLEFLIGRLMGDAISNLGLGPSMRAALKLLDVDYDEIAELEADAALGNGGLGRLAACFMESMATVGVPAYGYGIRYRHGLFRQEILDGWQAELPETWLEHGNPWEFDRREAAYDIGFGGSVEYHDPNGAAERYVWHPAERVKATAYDTPVVGWRAHRVNTLRLWKADPIDPIRLDAFNAGDHTGSLVESNRADALTRVLYPADTSPAGQELRLRQEYFFSSASLQDILRRHNQQYGRFDNLPEKVAIQLNDTHPAVCVAELMRLLMDEHEIEFDEAWELTLGTIAYTNHTLLPEALETWSVPLFERLLPRHMQIIYEINARLLKEARNVHKMSDAEIRRVSLIDETGERRVRMGNLAFVGAHSINGVAAMHSELLKETVFKDLHRMFPDRINNKTNGITPRRWLMQCNPGLTELITDTIGPAFLDDIDRLRDLEPYANDPAFQDAFARVEAAEQGPARAAGARPDGHPHRPERDVRHPGQAHPRIQAPAPQHHRDGGALRPDPLAPGAELGAAGQDLRRQGGADLPQRQADHQARQRRGAGDQLQPHRPQRAEGGVRAELQRQPRRDAGARGRSLRADLDRRHGGVGHRQHEVRAERRADHRHARRRQRRDPRAGGAGEHRHLRPDRRGGRREARRRPRPAQGDRELARAQPGAAAIASGVFSPDDPGRYRELIGGLYEHDYFMVATDFDAYATAQREVDALWSDPSAWWREGDPEHRADGLVLVGPHHPAVCGRHLGHQPVA